MTKTQESSNIYDLSPNDFKIEKEERILPWRKKLLGKVAMAFSNAGEGARKGFESATSWWKDKTHGLQERHRAEESEQQNHGSLSDILDVVEEQKMETADKQPAQVAPGLYRSEFSGETGIDDIVPQAAARAKRSLGGLSVNAKVNAETAELAQLEELYQAEPRQDQDRNPQPKHQSDETSQQADRYVPMHGK